MLNRIVASCVVTALVSLALTACGGGGGGGSEEDQVARAANQHVKTVMGLLTGNSTGKDMLNAYAPECREGVEASQIDAALGFIRLFAPQLSQMKIEDVDLGKLTLEKTSEGYEVTVANPQAARIKANGKWQSIDEFSSSLGFEPDDAPTELDAVLLVKRDGKWLLGECGDLEDFAGDSGLFGDNSPPAGSTPRPSTRTGPGSSRTNPVRLGQAGRVDDTWEITVVAVDRDAWPKLQAENRFNEAPKAGERMLLISVRAKNISSAQKPENIDAYSFSLTGSRNRLYDQFDEDTECGFVPKELDADLFPNGQAEGNVCFKVPADETGFVLVWEEFFSDELTYFALE